MRRKINKIYLFFIIIFIPVFLSAGNNNEKQNSKKSNNIKSIAIIIDIDKFCDQSIPDIRFHEKKALELFETLKLNKEIDEVKLFSTFFNKDSKNYPDKSNLISYFENLKNIIQKDTNILIYCSTYSYKYQNKIYLLTADTNLKNISDTAIELNKFINFIDELKTETKIVFFNIGKRISDRINIINNSLMEKDYFKGLDINFPVITSSMIDEYCYFDWGSKSDIFISSLVQIFSNLESFKIKNKKYTLKIIISKIRQMMQSWLGENSVKQTPILYYSKGDESRFYNFLSNIINKVDYNLVKNNVNKLYKERDKNIGGKNKLSSIKKVVSSYIKGIYNLDRIDGVIVQFKSKEENDFKFKEYRKVKEGNHNYLEVYTYNKNFKITEIERYNFADSLKLISKILYDEKTRKKINIKILKNILFKANVKPNDSFDLVYQYSINKINYKVIEKYTFVKEGELNINNYYFDKGYIFKVNKKVISKDGEKTKEIEESYYTYFIDDIGVVKFGSGKNTYELFDLVKNEDFKKQLKIAKIKNDAKKSSFLYFYLNNKGTTGYCTDFDLNISKGKWLSLSFEYVPLNEINFYLPYDFYFLEFKYKNDLFDMYLFGVTNVSLFSGIGMMNSYQNILNKDYFNFYFYFAGGLEFKTYVLYKYTNFVINYGINFYLSMTEGMDSKNLTYGMGYYLGIGYYF